MFGGEVIVYYWTGEGRVVGEIVDHATASQWSHCAVAICLDDTLCYFESIPGPGFRLVPVEGDMVPTAIQRTGLGWETGEFGKVMKALARRPYSIWNGVLSVFGIKRKSYAIECANATSMILQLLGLNVAYCGTPQECGNEVERVTGFSIVRYKP